MTYLNRLKSNITKNYFYIFTTNLDLTRGIWMIYLATKGMSLYQLGILEGMFHVTSFIMEVPTGLVADVFGRKVSRVLGRVFSFTAIMLLILATNFYFYMLCFIFWALSYNLESGAGEALIYDSLKELKIENTYIKVAGRQELFYQISSLLALLIGGYLAHKNYKYALFSTAAISLIAILQAMSFTEPIVIEKINKNDNVFIVFKKQVIDSFLVIKKNKNVAFFIIFVEIIISFGTTLFFYLQNYFSSNGYTETKIGIILASASFFGAIFGSQTHRIEKVLKEKGILLIMPIISAIALWGLAYTKYHYIFYIVITVVESITFVALSDYINKNIPSEKRATILSIASMVFSFFMIFIFPIIGKIGDIFSLQIAFKLLAILGTVLVILNTYFIMNIKSKDVKLRNTNN